MHDEHVFVSLAMRVVFLLLWIVYELREQYPIREKQAEVNRQSTKQNSNDNNKITVGRTDMLMASAVAAGSAGATAAAA